MFWEVEMYLELKVLAAMPLHHKVLRRVGVFRETVD